jgi:hypothetical protein
LIWEKNVSTTTAHPVGMRRDQCLEAAMTAAASGGHR